MASYSYEAFTQDGKVMKGSIEGENENQVRAQLKNKGYIVTSITEASVLQKDISISFDKAPSPRDLGIFCRQFVSMSRAGVSILECLTLLREQTENKKLAKAIREVQAEVEKGEPLSVGLSKHPKIFSDLMVTTVNAGEQSGSLETSLERMADQYEKSAKTSAMIKKAMIYPVMVGIVAVAVVILMLVKIIPAYSSMFNDLGADLPGITKAIQAASDFLIENWLIISVVVIGVIVAFKMYLKTYSGKVFKAKFTIKFPITKNLVVKGACSQIARTLSTLLAAGVSLVDAVDIVSDTMQNQLFKEAMKEAKEEVVKGVPLSVPLEESGLFPPMMYHMIRVGEEAGNSEEMLTKLADYYDEEVEMATQSLTAAMEPVIIIVLAGIVALLIASIMAPMVTMYDSLDNL